MKCNKLIWVLCSLFAACVFSACSKEDSTWDPYHDWQARNARWFAQVADSARRAIAEAKSVYGEENWTEHCEWRMYKSLQKSADVNSGRLTDSICVKVMEPGTGTVLPNYNDTVRLSFRGWLMETQYDDGDGGLYSESRVFTQTYYGKYDPSTAAPSTARVADMIEGFKTALQYMPEGADWYVYLPQELAYGAKAESEIPAYSTLLFRINMRAVYPAGSGVPAWKVRKR